MYKWFCVNKLSLNIAKINDILFGRHSHQQDAEPALSLSMMFLYREFKPLNFLAC